MAVATLGVWSSTPEQFASFLGYRALRNAALVSRALDEGPPLSVTYQLTDAGRALLPALEQISRWADEYLPVDRAGRHVSVTGKNVAAPHRTDRLCIRVEARHRPRSVFPPLSDRGRFDVLRERQAATGTPSACCLRVSSKALRWPRIASWLSDAQLARARTGSVRVWPSSVTA
jgi:hypothetical protein